SPPQRDCLLEIIETPTGVVLSSGLRAQAFESGGVDMARGNVQGIATGARLDGVVIAGREQLSQLRHVRLPGSPRAGRRLLSPQPPEESVGRALRTGVPQEVREEAPPLRAAQLHGPFRS